MVGPKVAAAAAQRALEVLAEDDPAVAAEAAAREADEQQQQNGQADQDTSAAPGRVHGCCMQSSSVHDSQHFCLTAQQAAYTQDL